MVNRRNALAVSREGHGLTRREVMHGLAALFAPVVYSTKPQAAAEHAQEPTATNVTQVGPYDSAVLPAGVRSRFVNNANGLRMHVLEAGFGSKGRPSVVLLHGFPELAYSADVRRASGRWRGTLGTAGATERGEQVALGVPTACGAMMTTYCVQDV